MNLGVYIESLGMQDRMHYSKTIFDIGRQNNVLKDTSVFYDAPQRNMIDMGCGIFNSTDLWNFSGTLITYSLKCTKSALNIVNNIDIIYFFCWEEYINIFDLLGIMNKVKLVSKTKEGHDELFRITGKRSKIINTPRDIFYE